MQEVRCKYCNHKITIKDGKWSDDMWGEQWLCMENPEERFDKSFHEPFKEDNFTKLYLTLKAND